jgi:hypothetical protein
MTKFCVLLLVLAAVILCSREEIFGRQSKALQCNSGSIHSVVSSFFSYQVLLSAPEQASHIHTLPWHSSNGLHRNFAS